MAATIKHIAQLAGVSRGTVDRVLNQRGGVNQDTAACIRAIAKELEYKPNLVAKSMSEKGAHGQRSIGILVNAQGNPFFDEVLAGIIEKGAEIEDFGFQLNIKTLKGFDMDQQIQEIDRLVESGISGLVITPINRSPLAEKLHWLQNENIPVVCLNTDVENAPRLAYVGSDYRQSGRVAAGLFGLLSGGEPKKLAIITGSFMVLGHHLRVEGFCECVKDEFPDAQIVAMVENNDNDIISYKTTKAILEDHPDLTGLFFSAGGIEGGLNAIADANLLGRLHVVSVDLIDAVKRHLQEGSITATICQEPRKQGIEAIRIMFDLLLGRKRPEADILTETQIIIKHSLQKKAFI